MPRPLQGANDWAPAARSDTPTTHRPDTIERVIERRVPAAVVPPAEDAPPIQSRAPAVAQERDPLRYEKRLEVPPRLPATLSPGSPAYLFAANRTLSGSALKVLLAVLETGEGVALLRNDFKRLTGLSGDHAILNAVQECVDNAWLLRCYQCRWCQASVASSYDTIRLIECHACGRKMTPQAVFCLNVPQIGVPNEHTGVPNEHTTSKKVEGEQGMSFEHTGVPNEHTISASNERQYGSSTLEAKIEGMLKKHTGMPFQHTDGVSNKHTSVSLKHTPHARADSESESRIRDSDSRFPPLAGNAETGRVVYASQHWQQITEKLAKDSAKRIGDKSVGFHVKVWAHARKLDWEKGGRRFEEGLLAIAQELESKHNGSGRSQGAMWTKMVRRYFEEKGSPLLTEAEVEEWKELHGSYTPPAL